MTNKVAYGIAWAVALVALGVGLFFYQALPEQMVSHWNALGQADGYMGKLFSVLLLPAIIIVAASLLMYIPRMDPLKQNIAAFRSQYNLFVVIFCVVLAVIQGAVIAVNLGNSFNIGLVIMPALGVLFFSLGIMLPRTKRNWFVGIRTPWTISSDEVWQRTHKLGGLVFKILGIVAFASVLAPTYAVYIFVVPLLVAVIGLVVYSYIAYRELGIRA